MVSWSQSFAVARITHEKPRSRAENEGGKDMSDTRYPTRMHEILMEEREMTPEERLLREIFAKSEQDEMPDNYPETYFEKADYALFCLHKVLEYLSPALVRSSQLCRLLRVGERDGKNTLPDIITHNESRMALRHLTIVKRDVDEAYQEILSIFESTKEPVAVSKTESVGQAPEPGGEVE